ncbi:hypothetical protein CEP54_015044 [Fusarium duplospermum]|uniref:Uncharacterized protein n=1 Tax=Fusarium duplospermum TaxID=1325734 RepID=A0A428NRY8_9HYPO|nr:hypothetical protein CEP54_015044 [Fusarium duplospermum]
MVIPEHLIEKYAAEREKRLRPDQVAQFVDFRDPALASMDTDPYFLIAGAGMLGLMTAHHLVTKAGISSNDIVLIDKAGGFGGTWYWNRYPGVVCDIEGYCYVPLLEETAYIPELRYSNGYEIREQLERIAHTWSLQGQFCTTVTDQKWDDVAKRWVVTMLHKLGPDQEPKMTVRSQFLLLAGGIQMCPHAPKLNGLGVFQSGPDKVLMHTGHWDWSKSGGSQEKRDMIKLQGATAVQVAPYLAKWAKDLYIFQRTPSYVGPQPQKETAAEDWSKVANKPSWQYERIASLDAMFTAKEDAEDKIQDGWTKMVGMTAMAGHAGKIIAKEEEEQHVKEMLNRDYPWTEDMRSHVDALVKDPSTAEKLKVWYSGFCKRPTFHPEYLSLFNEPNVTLVDTDGKGVEAYTPNGVMANGREHELDVLVLATGYTVGLVDSCPSSALNANLTGRENRLLKDKWDGPEYGTLYGAMTEGFPNLFFASGNGSTVSQNAHSFYNLLTRLIAHIVKEALSRGEDPDRATVEV